MFMNIWSLCNLTVVVTSIVLFAVGIISSENFAFGLILGLSSTLWHKVHEMNKS